MWDGWTLTLIEALWDEYFANRYSHGPWSDTQTFVGLLRDTVAQIEADVVGAILKYRTSGNDLNALLAVTTPKVKFVAQCFGYAMGSLAAQRATLSEFAPEVASLLDRLGLTPAWQECFAAVVALDSRRPWVTVLELRTLLPACVTLLRAFGLHYRREGDGAYIDIPMTPETDPLAVMAKRLSGT